MKSYLVTFLLSLSAYAAPSESFWAALHTVETGGRVGAILGDGGKALGPLQIHRSYHADARIPGGDYSRCAELAYSRRVAEAYLKRYAPEAWRAGDVETLARVHNGGPKGASKSATLPYARRVLDAMSRK